MTEKFKGMKLQIQKPLPTVTPKEWMGFILAVAAGSLMVAYAYHGLSKTAFADSHAAIPLTCLEFANADDQSVFDSTGVVREGSRLSSKPEQDCKGRLLQKVTIK